MGAPLSREHLLLRARDHAARDHPRRVRSVFDLGQQPELPHAFRAVTPPHGEPVRGIVAVMIGRAQERDRARTRIVAQMRQIQINGDFPATRRTARAMRRDQHGSVRAPGGTVIAAELRGGSAFDTSAGST